MASTRLNNDKGWYCQQQEGIRKYEEHELWKFKCISNQTAFPCAGINMPMMTNGYNNNILSQDAPDIESALFGIGSTNLVKPKKPTIARLNSVGDIAFFRRLPVYMPEPLVVEKCQRPAGPFG